MFQVIASWNLSRPDQEMVGSVKDTRLRGDYHEAFLTGDFAVKLKDREIRPLSVSNIADKICPSRRDLYFSKGVNRLPISRRRSWGRKVGYFVESYIETMLRKKQGKGNFTYSSLQARGRRIHENFTQSQDGEQSLRKLRALETTTHGVKQGDSEWLLTSLDNNGRAELGLRLLHSSLQESSSLDVDQIEMKKTISPNIQEIGINSPAEPDFIAPNFSIVGDIKTGIKFEAWYQLTCAGYALAYENEHGQKENINWGIIYFFPTRIPSALVRPLTFAQVYIFPIDDSLRNWFLNQRNEAYNIISKEDPPPLPDDRTHCPYCRFKEHCEDQGLRLDDA